MENNSKVFVPPLKIQGIKTKMVPAIRENLPAGESTKWIEPFMGSGVVGFNVAPATAIFADINPHIIEFYRQIKTGKITSQLVREFLEDQGGILREKDEAHYYEVRDRFNKSHDPLDFLFLNRADFNGIIRFNKSNCFNVPYGHKPERFTKAYITKIVHQVSYLENLVRENDWQFICQSFEKTIALADEKTMIYCDPPYIGRHVDYYDRWDEAQEIQLHDALIRSRAKFMLSTWDHNIYRKNEYIDTLWRDCRKITHEHFYYVGAKEENRRPIVEALLTNYDPEDYQQMSNEAASVNT